jgi:hypothetical protein
MRSVQLSILVFEKPVWDDSLRGEGMIGKGSAWDDSLRGEGMIGKGTTSVVPFRATRDAGFSP